MQEVSTTVCGTYDVWINGLYVDTGFQINHGGSNSDGGGRGDAGGRNGRSNRDSASGRGVSAIIILTLNGGVGSMGRQHFSRLIKWRRNSMRTDGWVNDRGDKDEAGVANEIRDFQNVERSGKDIGCDFLNKAGFR